MTAKTSRSDRRRFQLLALTVGAGIAAASFAPAAAAPLLSAQQAVVQPIPGPEQADLANALRRLNADPRSLGALIDAGNAALALGDVDGAIAFFGRAQDLAPTDPRIKAGLAGAYMRSDRPLDALRLFEEAERAGQVNPALASERGLAYDLVGDSASAQAQYNRALIGGGDPEATRRLALSQAIEGNREGFERTIRPLLDQRDFAAYRTRAFGLAILGDVDEAKAITDAVMPPAMAQRIGPYLQYMPRLTKAQQAAAANLGIFPRAAQIGRDDPRIARYGAAQQIDRALAPQGRPLGAPAAIPAPTPAPSPQTSRQQVAQTATRQRGSRVVRGREQRERRQRAAIAAASNATQSSASTAPAANYRERRLRREEQARVAAAQRDAQTERVSPTRQVAAATPASRGTPPPELQPAPQPIAQPANIPVPQPEPVRIARAELPPVAVGTPPSSAVEPVADPIVTPAPTPALSARPSVDIVLPEPAAAAPAAQPTVDPSATTRAPEPSVPPPAPQDLSSAFADFTLPPTPAAAAASGAVDITAIEVPRETAPAPPPAPSRVWVQVATGRDRSALRFDWRRIARGSDGMLDGRGPFVVEWGEANRLLAGPYDSSREANAAVAELKEKGQDAFVYTSPTGQEIEQLQ